MEIQVEHLGALQFEIKAREHDDRLRSAAGEWRVRRGHDAAGVAAGVAGIVRGLLCG